MDTIKELGRDLWKNKPMLIAVVIGLIAVIYIIYKNSGGAAITAPASATDTSAAGPSSGTLVQDAYYQGASGPVGAQGPAGPAGPAGVAGPIGQPPKVAPMVSQPTTGLLGPKASISKKNGVYVYKSANGQTGFLSSVLPNGAAVRGGSNGRWWYIQNGLKFLITSGNGPAVTNNATDANAK